MGVDFLRNVNATWSHGIRIVQSCRNEHAKETLCETTGNSVLENAEFPHELEDQADSTQIREARQP